MNMFSAMTGRLHKVSKPKPGSPEWVRDGIATFIEDNWQPGARYYTETIVQMVRSIEINVPK